MGNYVELVALARRCPLCGTVGPSSLKEAQYNAKPTSTDESLADLMATRKGWKRFKCAIICPECVKCVDISALDSKT